MNRKAPEIINFFYNNIYINLLKVGGSMYVHVSIIRKINNVGTCDFIIMRLKINKLILQKFNVTLRHIHRTTNNFTMYQLFIAFTNKRNHYSYCTRSL